MNPKLLYGGIGFVVGLVIGGGSVGIFVTKSARSRMLELEIQNDDLIKENRKLAHRGPRGREKGLKTHSSQEINVTNPFEKEDDDFDRTARERREHKAKIRTDYAELSKQYQSEDFDQHFETRVGPQDDEPEEDEDDDEDDDLIDETDSDIQMVEYKGDPNGEIIMISEDDFKDDYYYRDSDQFIYYQEDDVLTTVKNEVIQDQEKILGPVCMGMICDTTEDTLYIDNEIEDAIYEIIVNHNESFFRDIIGGVT